MLDLVSIYIPTHNRRKFLERAIKSVQKQTYANIELIVVDDGSSDDTWDYLSSIANENIKTFKHEKPLGACVARNLAIGHAKGKFVTGLDDDDEFLPERIATLIKQYDNSYAFICTGFLWNYGSKCRRVDATAKVINLKAQLNYNYATNQVLVERERLLAIGGFDNEFVACQDYDTWTRLIKEFGPAKRIEGALYVIHRDKGITRLTQSDNWLKGHNQFMAKHQKDMTEKNQTNQEFRRIIAQQQPLKLKFLYTQLKAGLMWQKCRYFLSSNLKFLAKIRRQILEK